MNKVILIGHTGKDPESRQSKEGKTIVSFSLATSEGKDKTEWHNIVAFDKTADLIAKYVKKGSHVAIDGRIQTRAWDDKEGNKRYTTEIICDRIEFLSKIEQATESYDATPIQPAQGTAAQSEQPPADDLDLPF